MFSPDGTLISASAAPHCGVKGKASKGEKKVVLKERWSLIRAVVLKERWSLIRVVVFKEGWSLSSGWSFSGTHTVFPSNDATHRHR